MTSESDTQQTATQQDELTVGERALAEAVYNKPYSEMDGWKQSQFERLLDDLPERIRAGLSGNLLTKDQLAEGMHDVFVNMVEDDDLSEEWKDGAAVFAKAMKKKFDLEGSDV